MSEKELPAGWAKVRLRDILAEPLINGRSVRTRDDGFPVLRLTALKRSGIDLTEHKNGAWDENEAAPYRVTEGDFLLSRGNGSLKLVGRGALVPSSDFAVAFPDTMIRVRANRSVIAPGFLRSIWDSAIVRQQIEGAARTTAGIYKINQKILEGVGLPLPPLAEQHRIVEALEDRLSRLDAGRRTLEAELKRIASLRKSILLDLMPEKTPDSWELTTVNEAGKVELGRARHPDWHHGPEMRPYLRVANVFEDRIDTSDVMEMDFSGIFEKYRLKPGDVLLNEGQSPHLVGRPALYRGTPPDVAFTNSLLRFQARADVLPEWALLVFRRHLHARRFMREVRITTNIAHLSAKRLKSVEFPIPPLEEQKLLVQRSEELFSGVDALEKAVTLGLSRANYLRRSILDHAFSGRLVAQDPAEEPAAELLARIQAERAAQPKAKRTRRTQARKSAAVDASPPPPTPSTPLPPTAVQQEFEL